MKRGRGLHQCQSAMDHQKMLCFVSVLCVCSLHIAHAAEVNLDDYPDVVDMSHRLKTNDTVYFVLYKHKYLVSTLIHLLLQSTLSITSQTQY